MGIEGEPPTNREIEEDEKLDGDVRSNVLDFESFRKNMESAKKAYDAELVINAELQRIFARCYVEVDESDPLNDSLIDHQYRFEEAERRVEVDAPDILEGKGNEENLTTDKRFEMASGAVIESSLDLLNCIREMKDDPHWGLDDDPDLAPIINKIIENSEEGEGSEK